MKTEQEIVMETEQDIVVDSMNAETRWQKGVTTVEYAVMLVLIAIAVFLAAPGISSAIVGVFTRTSSILQ